MSNLLDFKGEELVGVEETGSASVVLFHRRKHSPLTALGRVLEDQSTRVVTRIVESDE